jgi:hypothetical protein
MNHSGYYIMPHGLIEEQVDIYQFPKSCDATDKQNTITIGDLHGNAMKLMFMLVKQGIATQLSAENYNTLVQIYKKPVDQLAPDDIKNFTNIIQSIQFKPRKIRLIGDELADRGSNDYFTLKILERLHEEKVPVEIMISNHSMEFLKASEKFKENGHFRAPLLEDVHAGSLKNLNILLMKGIVSADEVLEIAKKAYKPNLKAISYSLDNDHQTITIYSHAPIGLDTVKNLAVQFGVDYEDASPTALALTIDAINQKFQIHVQKNTVHTQCPESVLRAAYSEKVDLTSEPLVCAMWNRNYDAITRLAKNYNYHLIYVHGHDSIDPDQDQAHVYNLDNDNQLGKSSKSNQGTYRVLNTHDYSFSLENLKQTFKKQLDAIKEKEGILRKDGHVLAADAAHRLYKTINESYKINLPNDLKQFQEDCKTAIQKARIHLEKHRGWKLLLSYLMLTITGLGIFVLADIRHHQVTGKHFSFFQTKSAQKLDHLEEKINRLQKP